MKTFLVYTNQTLTKHLTYFVSGGVIGIMLFTFLFYNEPELWNDYSHVILGAGFVGICIAYLLGFASNLISKVISLQRQSGIGLLLTIVVNGVLVYGISALYVYLYGVTLTGFISWDIYFKLAVAVFVLVLVYSVISLLIRSVYQLQQSTLDSVKLETKQIDLQLTALKAQLTPHFLFNSLNTISSLLHRDLAVAEKYIRNLASVYQYTLPSYEKKLVTFDEEWSFVKANLELLLVRFGGHLTIDVEEETAIRDIMMPPLTLQLLIENALKHNLINEQNPLSIKITREGKWWMVTNNITKKPNQVESFRVGLDNIRERYQLLGNRSIQVIESEEFYVKLPVL